MEFASPWFLLLLLLLPGILVLARKSRSGLEAGRAWTSTALRVFLFTAAAFALADAQHVSRSYRTATMFLLDHSYSIPYDVKKKATEWVNEQLKRLPKDDAAGVVLFGSEAMIELPPRQAPGEAGLNTVVGRGATDVGAAIRLALAVFPEGYQRRIVLVSDGNENQGHALAEAEAARAHGVVVDVFPLHYDYPREAWIEGLHVPPDLAPKEPFDVTVVVNSQTAGPAKLILHRNKGLLSAENVRLNKGKNVFTVRQKVDEPGNFNYSAVIEMEGDTVSENNVAHAVAASHGEARVAVVAGAPDDGEGLVRALREEGIKTAVLSPEELTARAAELASFDALVFANVEASRVPRGVLQAVEAAVHDAGVGFIMIGGEVSFGPGGYRGSPIEEILPVTMEQPQRRVIPNGALCLILHTCEIPEGNYWSKQIGIAALNTLNSRDYMGAVIFGGSGDAEWIFPPTLVTDKGALAKKIADCMAGDMPSWDQTYTLAHKGLKPLNAAAKHIIAISDADPSGPSDNLIDAIIKDRITISTIAIFPHGASDIDRMARTAQRAKGRFYHVTDPKTLPQIFIKEAATVQRSMIIEGPFRPVVMAGTEALKGISPSEIPPLHGYVLTNPKPALVRVSMGAPVAKEVGDNAPAGLDTVMAEWMYGLGKTMAFTSDAKPRWAKEWTGWANYGKFWSQAVRSVLRTTRRAPYAVASEVEGGKGRVVIDAVNEEGKFVHTLQFKGSVTSPEGKKSGLSFRQVGPGRYEAEFDATEVGVYSVAGTFEGAAGEKGFIAQGVPLSYAAEYRDLKANLPLLESVRQRTNGRRLGPETPVYVPLPRSAGVARPLWPWLLMFILVLFPIDIFIRRVAVDWGAVTQKALGKLKPGRSTRPAPAPVPAMIQALAAAKEGVREEILKPVEGVEVNLDAVPGSRPAPAPAAAAEARPAEPAPPPPKPAPAPAGDYLGKLLEAKKKLHQKE